MFWGNTRRFRALVYENVIPHAVQTELMTYEKASEVIRRAGYGAIAICTCRHKDSHLGKECEMNAPMETCTTLGNIATHVCGQGVGEGSHNGRICTFRLKRNWSR